jgi:UDP-glucose 4-epimerase
MRVLVTGGAGFVGGAVVEELLAAGHEAIVFDNLSKGYSDTVPEGVPLVRGDLADAGAVRATLARFSVDGVVHMAALSLVGESVLHPERYYRANVSLSLLLLDALVEAGVRRFVFSSSAAVYGQPAKQPIEEHDPTQPTNPYGETKLAVERALRWFAAAHPFAWMALRYFNAAGATERIGERHEPETHLIPLVLRAAAGLLPHVEVYGEDYPTPDGTCIRDYVHVSDLARAHVLALEALDAGSARSGIYNLGCGGNGYSVREVIASAERVTGREVPVRVAPRRPGDPAVLVASSDRIGRELGWRPRLQDLDTIVGSAWRWFDARGWSLIEAEEVAPRLPAR